MNNNEVLEIDIIGISGHSEVIMDKQSKIFVAGASGMVGSAIVRKLINQGYTNIIGSYHNRKPDPSLITHHSLLTTHQMDLTNQQEVHDFFQMHQPDHVVIAAAKVGGIFANNTCPADFIYDNLIMENNVIQSAHQADVQHLLFLGSSCIYPREAEQPMREEALLTGPLEATNEPYAVAKIAGIKLCESFNRQHGRDYRSVMPTNLYGPGDNFHPENSHVIPALLRRFHEAKEQGAPQVTVWGSGRPRREFLHVDDLAAACVHIMGLDRESYAAQTEPQRSHLNVGTGTDLTIRELAETIQEVVSHPGELVFDDSMPDGVPRKLLDVSRLEALGWSASISLQEGLRQTYEWYLINRDEARG